MRSDSPARRTGSVASVRAGARRRRLAMVRTLWHFRARRLAKTMRAATARSGGSAMPELDGFAAASGSRRLVTLQGKRKRKDLRLRAPNDADLTVPLEDGQQHVT